MNRRSFLRTAALAAVTPAIPKPLLALAAPEIEPASSQCALESMPNPDADGTWANTRANHGGL